jgi:hypothetical protein
MYNIINMNYYETISNDTHNFKKQILFYVYYVCGCDVEDIALNYCQACFPDYDTHINGMDDIDKSSLNKHILNKPLLAFKNNYI